MLESFIGSFVICQLFCKLLLQDNAFFKCFIGGFLPRILFEKQRISFDVYCQFTFFVLNQAYVIYVFALPLMLFLGSFSTWQACFCWSSGPHMLFTILVSFWHWYFFYAVLSLYHLSVQPFLTIL